MTDEADVSGPISGLDVHFEDVTAGFLIKDEAGAEAGAGISRVTVLGPGGRQVGVRASHGPFLSRQTLTLASPSLNATGRNKHFFEYSKYFSFKDAKYFSPAQET